MNLLFNSSPKVRLLQQLAKGSLDQPQNLTRAVRLYTLLRWLYSDIGYNILPNHFTYTDWRSAFFTETHQDEKREDIETHQDSNCFCQKTTEHWFLKLDVAIGKWQSLLQQEISIPDSELDKLQKERLFAQVRKSLQSDFELLFSRGWLQKISQTTSRSKQYSRVSELPISKELDDGSLFNHEAQAYVADTLEMVSFLDPNLPLIVEQISAQAREKSHRVFLYVDYVVPESSSKQDDVDQFQSELQEIWNSGNIKPLLLTYHSAHRNTITECVVYPVCIYYMGRAKYLCAYGSSPKHEINWHNYRLDRICSNNLKSLEWTDPRVPQLLQEQYQSQNLPTPETIKSKLDQAWGFDFYKESKLMLLRFEQDFHENYIAGTFLHQTCEPIDYNQAMSLVKQHTRNPQQCEHLLSTLESRPNTDAYYQLLYRVTDYHVVRRLRALGSKVEVLLPWELRQEIALEIQKTWNLYSSIL